MAFKMKGFPMMGAKTHAKSKHDKEAPYIGQKKMMGGEEYVWLKGDIYGDGTWVISNEETKDAEYEAMMKRIEANKKAGVYDPDYDGSVEPKYER
tara:strand:+ start:14 stop:298 length:285 start_codon:yes stop_codon:yes gene_type:complete